MDLVLSKSLICLCNGKLYKTSSTFKNHQKSQLNLSWELPFKNKDLQIKTTQLENENNHLKRLNILLMERISDISNN